MKPLRTFFVILAASSSLFGEPSRAGALSPPINKLQQMFRFYYLPFSIDFKEGKTTEEIYPFAADKYKEFTRLIKPEELQKLDGEWEKIRETWKKKSLFLSTPINLNESVRLSPKLASHRINLARSAWFGLTLTDRVQLESMLSDKPAAIQQAVTQLRILKSLLKDPEEEKFNFFIIGPHWCDSSREYRALLEAYFKELPATDLILHSVVIEDPKEEIFDSQLMKDLFPHPERYSHEIVPRFLAFQTVNGQTTIWEEGEALKELYERFYRDHRGFLDQRITALKHLFPNHPATPSHRAHKGFIDPKLSLIAQ
jgi:hypothetical protein